MNRRRYLVVALALLALAGSPRAQRFTSSVATFAFREWYPLIDETTSSDVYGIEFRQMILLGRRASAGCSIAWGVRDGSPNSSLVYWGTLAEPQFVSFGLPVGVRFGRAGLEVVPRVARGPYGVRQAWRDSPVAAKPVLNRSGEFYDVRWAPAVGLGCYVWFGESVRLGAAWRGIGIETLGREPARFDQRVHTTRITSWGVSVAYRLAWLQ